MLTPYMSMEERSFIEKFLNKSDTMLEWGSGGSTVCFAELVDKMYSIEHDKNWFDKINSIKPENVEYYFVEQNAPRTRPTKKEEFINYINFIDTIGVERYDVVFVDGRARKFCALKALDYINKESKVIIHDWERPIYKEVLNSYDIIDEIRRVGILRKK